MSKSSPASNVSYYSAYRGPIFGVDGNFNHFARQCDLVHVRNGYWIFSTCDDDRRAFKRGYGNPEEVLKAQDAGGSEDDDIMLCWVPGELDASNKPLVGSAATHLQTICSERKLLGKTLSFRGTVPLYPIGNDPKILQYRVARYGTQKGMLPNNVLAPKPPSQGSPSKMITPRERLPTTSIAHISPSKVTSRAVPAMLTSAPIPPSQVLSSSLIAIREPVQTKSGSDSLRDLQSPSPTEQHYCNDSPLDPSVPRKEDVLSTLAIDLTNNSAMHQLEENSLFDEDKVANYMYDNDLTDHRVMDNVGHLTLAASTPADLFHDQVAALSCMDCGGTRTHTSDCWIDKVERNLRPAHKLTTSELGRIVDDVGRFDPGPWKTHYGSQQEPVEDARTQLIGVAEVIRNLDTTADDPELLELDDHLTVVLWALKSNSRVQVLKSESDRTDVMMLDT